MTYFFRPSSVEVRKTGKYSILDDLSLPIELDNPRLGDFPRSSLFFEFLELPPGLIDFNNRPVPEYPNLAEIALSYDSDRVFEVFQLNYQRPDQKIGQTYNFQDFGITGRIPVSGMSIYFPREPVRLRIEFDLIDSVRG